MDEQPQSDGTTPADTTSRSSRNDVACSTMDQPLRTGVRRRSGIHDSKHSNAATLAIDLASSSAWSDTMLTQAIHVRESNSIDSSMGLRLVNSSLDEIDSEYVTLGPPPEYSPYQERALPLEPNNSAVDEMRHSSRRPEMSEGTLPTHRHLESDQGHGVDAPLLGQSSHKSAKTLNPPGSNQALDQQRGPNFKQRLIVAIIFLAFILAAAIGYLRFNHHDVRQWRILPLVPTDRNHTQHSTHDHISGCFELHERLELSTTTGDIDIQIDPQASKDHNNSSTLILSSSTGKITLGISEAWFGRRERALPTIHTEIKTITGTVKAGILLGDGGSAVVSTVSGAQDVRVYTYKAAVGDPISHLTTISHIGDQVVALTHFDVGDTTIDTLQADHRSHGTGNIDLQYSKHWRGRIHAKATPVGQVEVQGDGRLVFDQEGQHEVIAHKGKGDDLKTVDVISEGTGSIAFKSWYIW